MNVSLDVPRYTTEAQCWNKSKGYLVIPFLKYETFSNKVLINFHTEEMDTKCWLVISKALHTVEKSEQKSCFQTWWIVQVVLLWELRDTASLVIKYNTVLWLSFLNGKINYKWNIKKYWLRFSLYLKAGMVKDLLMTKEDDLNDE